MDIQSLFKNLLLKQSSPPRPNTVKNYVADIRYFTTWFEKTYNRPFTLSELTSSVVELFSQDTAVSPRTKERHNASLRKLISLLNESGESIPNPFPTVSHTTHADTWKLREFKHFLYKQKISAVTVKNYMSDIAHFTKWLDAQNITPEDIKGSKDITSSYANTLVHVLNLSPKSVSRKLSSIRKYCDYCGLRNSAQGTPQPVKTMKQAISHSQGKNLTALEAFRVREQTYSRIAPIRLLQHFVYAYGKAEEKAAYHFSHLISRTDIRPVIKRPELINTVRHSRPKWYKRYHSYSITRYIHIGVLTIFSSGLLLLGYARYIDVPSKGDVLGTEYQNRRVLVYSGKLAKTDNTPITTPSTLTFSIYPDQTANTTVLWRETHEINPNKNGSFTVQLGRKEILSDSFFSDNQNLYLGMKIGGGPELLPRKRLANVGYAEDSSLLQGMAPITQDPANTSNSILALDSSGNLVIGGSANPVFQATGGDFTFSGTTTILTTAMGSNGDIILNPDGTGVIDVRNPLANNSTDASSSGSVDFADEVVIASDSASSLFTVHNTGLSGDIMTLMSQNITRMIVDNAGNVGIGTETPSQLVHIAGDSSPTLSVENKNTLTRIDMSALATLATLGTYSNTSLGFKTNDLVRMSISPTGNVGIGTSSPTALLDVAGSASIAGTLTLSGATPNIQSANNSNLIIGGNNTGNLIFQPLNNNGFVGISTNNPQYKLDIRDNQASRSAMQIYNASTSSDADGLMIRLGNNSASLSATNTFVNFQTNGLGTVGSITGNGTGVVYNTTNADFAEYFKKDITEDIPYGTITCITSSGTVSACSHENTQIIGVTSQNPAFLGGKNLGTASVAVGLVGQIETWVSTQNGSITAGDPITLSATPGTGVKATTAGMIVGRALQSYTGDTPGKILVLVQPSWHEPRTMFTTSGELVTTEIASVELDNSTYDAVAYALAQSTAKVRRENTWVSEVASFASATIGKVKTGLLEAQNVLVSGTIAAQHIVVEQLDVTNDNIRINGLSLSEYIASILPNDNATPEVATAQTISSNFISPLADDSDISISLENSQLSIHNSAHTTGSAVASIDNEGNATFSGSLAAESGQFNDLSINHLNSTGDASIAGTLSAESIRANTIEGLDEKVASYAANYLNGQKTENDTANTPEQEDISPSFITSNWHIPTGNFIDVSTMSAQFALFHENLLSLGTTTLREATVMDSFSIGTNFIFGPESVDVLGADLQIQPLRQGGISFLAGLVAIDTNGNLAVGGDAAFAKNVTIKGGLFANIISPLADHDLDIFLSNKNGTQSAQFRVINDAKTPVLTVNGDGDVYSSGSANFVGNLVASGSAFLSKLNIFSQEAQAVSENDLVASSSAGTAVLRAYKREVTIHSPYVSGDSLIYITPSTDTGNQVLYLLRQSENGSFTVGVSQSLRQDIQFNWFVVN